MFGIFAKASSNSFAIQQITPTATLCVNHRVISSNLCPKRKVNPRDTGQIAFTLRN